MHRVLYRVIFAGVIAGAACALAEERPHEPVVGGPCEGCEAVFQGLPKFESLSSRAPIAPRGEPGAPMRIEGTVYDAADLPSAGVIVYAYHTDDRGVYPPDERFPGQAAYRHGRLRAWVVTDAKGRYVFETIRPAGYPGTNIPAHVHMHVIEPGCCTYWIDDINFEDDTRLSERDRARRDRRGGSGLVTPVKDKDGVWVVTRDIRLGENVPNHPAEDGR